MLKYNIVSSAILRIDSYRGSISLCDSTSVPETRCYIRFHSIEDSKDWYSIENRGLAMLLKATLQTSSGGLPDAIVDYLLETDVLCDHRPVYDYTPVIQAEQLEWARELFRTAVLEAGGRSD
jgi:hypothetical protein